MLRRALLALLLGVPTLVGLVAVGGAPAGADPLVLTDADGIHVVGLQQLDDRLYQASVASGALGRAVRVRILVPADYSASGQRYPVLYLFHGTSGGAPDWTTLGDAEATTAGLPLIVVMPDAGFDDDGGGWFTNWVDRATALGPSQWETFHVDQLVPWVDANLRTLADRGHRAIAGLSQGGFGAMSYAARHPDTFGIAASFSGAPEIDRDAVVLPASSAIISGTAVGLDGVEPDAMFGSRLTNEINWQGHDPAGLIPNLTATDIHLWTGDGASGPFDPATPDLEAAGIEFLTHVSTVLFHQHLTEAGIPSQYVDYGAGTHTWPYWARDLREFVPALMADLAAPPATPATITYTSVEQQWTQWGWTVVNHRAQAQQFETLADAGPAGFRVTAAGTPTVTTPPAYEPGSAHAVTVGAITRTLTADASGRLTITVPSGTGLFAASPGTVAVRIG
ncbi:MAG: alpha/beta hydrolase [Jatrophihabitans sp.]|uniref:alpha/beta hydrolase n=1 Tax=Jatrophihabitans sp. TaxID=1932789 RepID=UPI003F808B1F